MVQGRLAGCKDWQEVRSLGKDKKKRPYPACRPAKVAKRITKKEAAKKTGPRRVKWSVTAQEKERKKSGHQESLIKCQPATKRTRSTKSGAGMTKAGVAAYRRKNPGSKLKTAVTGKGSQGPGSTAAKRRKSYCARSAGQMKKFPKAAKTLTVVCVKQERGGSVKAANRTNKQNLAGTWMSGKVEEKKAQSATKVAKAQAEAVVMQKKATGEIDWDLEMARGRVSHLGKTNGSQYLFSTTYFSLFVPGMEELVRNGFQQLEQMPEWYQYSLGVIVAASFGVRSATKFFGKK